MSRPATTKDENPVIGQVGLDILDILTPQHNISYNIKPLRREYNSIVSVVHKICCGLDVHKKTITASTVRSELLEVGSFNDDLIKLRYWLLDRGAPRSRNGDHWLVFDSG